MVLPRPSRTRPTNLPASSTIWSKHGSRLTTPSLRSLKFVITSVASENSNLRQSKWVTRSCRLMPKTQFLEREKDSLRYRNSHQDPEAEINRRRHQKHVDKSMQE